MIHDDGLARVSISNELMSHKHVCVTQVRPSVRVGHRLPHEYTSILYYRSRNMRVYTFLSSGYLLPRSATCRRLSSGRLGPGGGAGKRGGGVQVRRRGRQMREAWADERKEGR